LHAPTQGRMTASFHFMCAFTESSLTQWC